MCLCAALTIVQYAYVHKCLDIKSITTTPSTHINGQCHLCVMAKAGDALRKKTVMPTTVVRTGIPCSNSVTVNIGIIRRIFVKAQAQISCIMAARCWYDTIVPSAVVHNLGWVE